MKKKKKRYWISHFGWYSWIKVDQIVSISYNMHTYTYIQQVHMIQGNLQTKPALKEILTSVRVY